VSARIGALAGIKDELNDLSLCERKEVLSIVPLYVRVSALLVILGDLFGELARAPAM
jgi:hypothetical protein